MSNLLLLRSPLCAGSRFHETTLVGGKSLQGWPAHNTVATIERCGTAKAFCGGRVIAPWRRKREREMNGAHTRR